MKLIIAEKPSVAKTIASFLKCSSRKDGYFEGKDYIVTYAFGHLVSLYDMKDYDKVRYGGSWKEENFPFVPMQNFKFKVEDDKKKQFNIIKSLIKRKDVESIINATDNDREGELISFLILHLAKNKKPVERILINEWTPEDISKGMKSLKKDSDMRNLQAAGYTRLVTDWLIGINFTSMATLRYSKGKMLNIGRVILPTVKLIYDRDKEIREFVPKDFFEIEAKFNSKGGPYIGKLTLKDSETRFNSLDDAVEKLNEVINIKESLNTDKSSLIKYLSSQESKVLELPKDINKGEIIKLDKKTVKEYPPKLFSLTTLQGYMSNKYNHFSADYVLKVCQSLYEGKGKGGFITYPRTDSNFLEESLKSKVKDTLEKLTKNHPLSEKIIFTDTKRVFNSKKVESHSAIIPTYIIPTDLTEDEKLVYEAIKERFLMNFMEPAEFENTEIHTRVRESVFVTKGKVLSKLGFLEFAGRNSKDQLLPKLQCNEVVDMCKINIKASKTTPPKHYTEETILKAMKNCGQKVEDGEDDILKGYSIGTSATRADVLKKILGVGYVIKRDKSYYITELGTNLVEIFPVKELFDVDYTGKLEKKLYDIQEGNYDRKSFMNEMYKFVYSGVNNMKKDGGKYISSEIPDFKFGKSNGGKKRTSTKRKTSKTTRKKL